MKTRRRIGAVAAVAATVLATLLLPGSQAQAASGCTDAHFLWNGYEAYYCVNRYGAIIYSLGTDGTKKPVNRMTTTTSWFACKWDGGPPNGETSPHPHRWLWTLGDDNDNEGWMSDKDIASETNPVTVCNI